MWHVLRDVTWRLGCVTQNGLHLWYKTIHIVKVKVIDCSELQSSLIFCKLRNCKLTGEIHDRLKIESQGEITAPANFGGKRTFPGLCLKSLKLCLYSLDTLVKSLIKSCPNISITFVCCSSLLLDCWFGSGPLTLLNSSFFLFTFGSFCMIHHLGSLCTMFLL